MPPWRRWPQRQPVGAARPPEPAAVRRPHVGPRLRQAVLDAVGGVSGSDAASHLNRARVAVFLALASPEYLVQR